jgi:hypothetical protein
MRRRMLSHMLQQQLERNRSEEVKATLVPAVNLSIAEPRPMDVVIRADFSRNDSDAFQGAPASSPPGSVPPAPAVLKRGPGRPRKEQ